MSAILMGHMFDAKTEGEPQNIRLYTLENTETE